MYFLLLFLLLPSKDYMKNKLAISALIALCTFNIFSMQLPEYETEQLRVTQPDGKTLILGMHKHVGNDLLCLYRYNQNNQLDATFGSDGIIVTGFAQSIQFQSIGVQPDGKIILKYTRDGKLIELHLNQNGSLNKNFGNNGVKILGIIKG